MKHSEFSQHFQTQDTTFKPDKDSEFKGSKKYDRLKNKAEKAGEKTEKARKKIPKKTEYSLERVFNEKTGTAKYVLTAVKKDKQFKPDGPVKMFADRIEAESTNYAHSKIAEVEKENSGVEAAHKTEQKVEDGYRFIKRHYKSKLQRQHEKVAKLEKKQVKAEVNFRYQKFLEENPQMNEKTLKKQLQKRMQKQRIITGIVSIQSQERNSCGNECKGCRKSDGETCGKRKGQRRNIIKFTFTFVLI